MKRLTQFTEREADRTKSIANQPGPTGAPGVQTADAPIAADAFSHSEDILDRNPVAPGHGGITDRINPICSFIVKNASVDCYSSVIFI